MAQTLWRRCEDLIRFMSELLKYSARNAEWRAYHKPVDLDASDQNEAAEHPEDGRRNAGNRNIEVPARIAVRTTKHYINEYIICFEDKESNFV